MEFVVDTARIPCWKFKTILSMGKDPTESLLSRSPFMENAAMTSCKL
jgi:hypothetical protein